MGRGRKALAKQAWEARYRKQQDDDTDVEEIEDLSHVYESQMKRSAFKKKQKVLACGDVAYIDMQDDDVCVYRYVCLTVWVVMVSKLDYVLLSEERG
jgi:uncharacterized protein YuzB (UPF0349 family)